MRLSIKSVLFILILLLAFGLRFYRLNQIPYGFTWDEASITYNAWGISLWNRDEYATKLPLAFRSFGDYKSPLTFYLLALPFKFFGLQIGLIRIYSALAGVLTVVGVYLISSRLSSDLRLHSTHFPLTTAFITALSPWALQMSRVGFEANLALTLIVWGLYFLFFYSHSRLYTCLGSLLLASSLYTYHSPKIFIPLIIISLLFYHRRDLRAKLSYFLTLLSTLFLTSLPLIYSSLFGQANTRASTLIFFDASNHLNSLSSIIINLTLNLIHLFSPQFWLGGIDAIGLRHLVPGFGIMTFATIGFFFLGIAYLLLKKPSQSQLLINWLILGFLPSLITYDSPHAIRSLLALPPLMILTSIGIQPLKSLFHRFSFSDYLYFGLVIMTISINTIFYLQTYYHQYAIDSATAFQYGYRDAFSAIKTHGKDNAKIILTDAYGQPYIYALLYQHITPKDYLFGGLANFEFRPINDWANPHPNYLYVGTPAEIPPFDPRVVQIIKVPQSDQIVFVVAES